MGTISLYQRRVNFWVFKALFGKGVCRCLFSFFCLHSVIFKLWQVDVRGKKTTDLVFNVFLFFRDGLCLIIYSLYQPLLISQLKRTKRIMHLHATFFRLAPCLPPCDPIQLHDFFCSAWQQLTAPIMRPSLPHS